MIGENEFFFSSSSIFTSFRSGEPEPGSSSNFKNNNRKGPIVRRFLEWLIEKASLYLDADVANEELEQSGDNGLAPPLLPPQRFVFKSV